MAKKEKPNHPTVKKTCNFKGCKGKMQVATVNVKNGVETRVDKCPKCQQRETIETTLSTDA